jgi:hypothetical protein
MIQTDSSDYAVYQYGSYAPRYTYTDRDDDKDINHVAVSLSVMEIDE